MFSLWWDALVWRGKMKKHSKRQRIVEIDPLSTIYDHCPSYNLKPLAGAGTSCPTPARWTMDSLDTYDLLWTRLLSNKIRRPLFCFPFKDRLHPKSFGAAISFLQHQMFRRVWLDEVFSSSYKLFAVKNSFKKRLLLLSLARQLFLD